MKKSHIILIKKHYHSIENLDSWYVHSPITNGALWRESFSLTVTRDGEVPLVTDPPCANPPNRQHSPTCNSQLTIVVTSLAIMHI